ncbi:MAG: PilZ domain-containing protein [Terriglobales bacterium]
MRKGTRNKDARRSVRLQLAIPVFVRSKDGDGKESLEFATALNISAGGALIIVRRSLPKASFVSLEIPSVPIGPGQGFPSSTRVLRAKTVWVAHLDDYHLLGLRFARPLSTNAEALPRVLRKAVAAV